MTAHISGLARAARVAAVTVALVGIGAWTSGTARAASPVASFTVTTSTQTAGGHPDLMVDLAMATTTLPPDTAGGGTVPNIGPNEYLKQVSVHLPPGLLASAASTPTCPGQTLSVGQPAQCPPTSELGTMILHYLTPYGHDGSGNPQPDGTLETPIINVAPLPDEAARFALPLTGLGITIYIDVTVADESDYGVVATATGIPSTMAINSIDLDFWGVPSAPAHDAQRLQCFQGGTVYTAFATPCNAPQFGAQTFLTNPTSCPGSSLPVSAAVSFYGDPTTYNETSDLPPTTGCGALPFSPSLAFASASGEVGQPDAFTAAVDVPQDQSNDTSGQTTAALQNLSLILPPGVSLSPGAAGGLSSCSDAQFGYGSHADQTCPLSSQIGTVTVNTPLLTTSLTGNVYIGAQDSSDPASGNMYRLFLAADGSGVHLKLIGNVSANPSTGQLTATFINNPQVQFSSLQLSLKGGPRAPLTNPDTCGTATSNWSISSYADPGSPVTGSSSFPVTGNCALSSQFTPALTSGTVSNHAGGSSPFSFTLSRPDGQRWVTGIPSVVLPTGLNADIASAAQCSNASAEAGSCPASSQVGTASVAAGAGSEPFNLTGQPVYLTGPYKGSPFGLAVVVNAIAGPFDLGTVVVRQAISVNPNNAQVTIHSDSLPTMLDGVPLDLQSISVNINRSGFMRSPTSCAAKSITASVQGSTPGAPANVVANDVGYAPSVESTAHLSSPFQMGDCGALKFSPSLSLEASGRGQTRTNSHPTLTAKLSQPANQANLSSVQVALPLSLALDPKNSEHVCSVKDAARIACPSRTVVGKATAVTRILPHSLSGKVYLVQGERKGPHGTMFKTTPSLLVPLDGADHVKINLRAQTSVNGAEQLVTTFQGIPDAGVKSFELQINGGRRGILEVTGNQNLCRGDETATIADHAQSGRAYYQSATLTRPACTAPKSSKKKPTQKKHG